MDKLDEIMAHKRREIDRRARPVPDRELARLAALGRPSFAAALRRPHGLAVIAEIKRRSPSAGAIAAGINAADQARGYYNAGADAISVLTDETYFAGSIRDLWDVNDLLANRSDTPPTLRKDFFVHPVQIVEAAEAGASAILLIVRALTDDAIRRLRDAAQLAGLDSLFEVHDLAELDRALRLEASLIGVNNRDLGRFTTDLALSEALIPQIPPACVAVSESGIRTSADAARMRAAGAHAILVGETLMRLDDPEPFIGACHQLP
jgi:indole-3-glycerol phosphate synthase